MADEFDDFVRAVEPRLRLALVARLGAADGREATAEALAWAWQTWPRASTIEKPVGYLYRVGLTRTRRIRRPIPSWETSDHKESETERVVQVRLVRDALAQLSASQRVAVTLVDGFGWTLAEVADLRRVGRSTIQKHLERGRARLRLELESSDDT